MSMGGNNFPIGSNGTLNAPGTGGITDAPLYGTPMQQFADPLHLFPSPTADNSAPGVLSNLGAGSVMPMKPHGTFVAPNTAGGGFNSMAARGAGPLFNPSIGTPKWPTQPVSPPGSQPATGTAPSGSVSPEILKMLKAGGISGLLSGGLFP